MTFSHKILVGLALGGSSSNSKDGTLDRVYKHWILGQDAAPKGPRWSIMRNVLHWTR